MKNISKTIDEITESIETILDNKQINFDQVDYTYFSQPQIIRLTVDGLDKQQATKAMEMLQDKLNKPYPSVEFQYCNDDDEDGTDKKDILITIQID